MATVIEGFEAYRGEHCETTAMGNLLQAAGVRLSEPMLFGLGQGLGFIYWDSKAMDFPFVGGRVKPDELAANLASRLQLAVRIRETSSAAIAWRNVASFIEHGVPVGLKLDSYYLDYFTSKVHFAAHYAVIYGFDEEFAYMADTRQQGGLVRTRLDQLALARNAKGPMSSRNRSFTLDPVEALPPLAPAVKESLTWNAQQFLHPPIRNIGVKGIVKMSEEIVKWLERSRNPQRDLPLAALLMERGGTGGALFRNMYRDFLQEAAELLDDANVARAHERFAEIASLWAETASLIDRAGTTGDREPLRQASGLLLDIADRERAAMELLLA